MASKGWTYEESTVNSAESKCFQSRPDKGAPFPLCKRRFCSTLSAQPRKPGDEYPCETCGSSFIGSHALKGARSSILFANFAISLLMRRRRRFARLAGRVSEQRAIGGNLLLDELRPKVWIVQPELREATPRHVVDANRATAGNVTERLGPGNPNCGPAGLQATENTACIPKRPDGQEPISAGMRSVRIAPRRDAPHRSTLPIRGETASAFCSESRDALPGSS